MFTQNWLDHLLLMASYLVTIATWTITKVVSTFPLLLFRFSLCLQILYPLYPGRESLHKVDDPSPQVDISV